MKKILSLLTVYIIPIIIIAVFVDSLRYKFTNHPNTQTIFGTLNDWAASIGIPGLFSVHGLFSQYVIGSLELLASLLLLAGFLPKYRSLGAMGAAIAFVIMTGALFFHLFTPLGIDPNSDGGGLFVMAVVLWVGSLVVVLTRCKEIQKLLGKKEGVE